jgi:hypothetical protein
VSDDKSRGTNFSARLIHFDFGDEGGVSVIALVGDAGNAASGGGALFPELLTSRLRPLS